MYNEGISRTGSVLDLGLEHKILEKKGAWISYNGDLIGQGREAAKRHLADNPDVMKEITDKILEKVQVVGGMSLAKAQEDASAEDSAQEAAAG
jgi:recombination protein RecA